MDKQKPIKLEYNEGCMSWGTYINDKPVIDYPLEDIKNLVKDLIDSNAFKTIRLEEIHRQAKDSSIIKLADAIRRGELTWDLMDYHDDLAFYRYTGGEIQKHLIDLYDSYRFINLYR